MLLKVGKTVDGQKGRPKPWPTGEVRAEVHDGSHWNTPQTGKNVGGVAAAHPRNEGSAACRGKQPLRRGRCQQHLNVKGARRLPEQQDPRRIAAECGDIHLHPLQRRDHVEQPVRPGRTRILPGQLWSRQKPQISQSVLCGHNHHALIRQRRHIELRWPGVRVSGNVSSAVKENHHRLRLGCRTLRSKDIERQAVFVTSILSSAELVLRTLVAERRGVANVIPAGGWLGRLPSEVPHGRRCKRNSAESIEIPRRYTTNCSGLGTFHGVCVRAPGWRWCRAATPAADQAKNKSKTENARTKERPTVHERPPKPLGDPMGRERAKRNYERSARPLPAKPAAICHWDQ